MNFKQNLDISLDNIKSIHFIGIGGIGMCGIARVLQLNGYQVSGSDMSETPITEDLKRLGVNLFIGHHPAHILACDVVVKSSAITEDNPELMTARDKKIPILERAHMLALLMASKYGIAIAGTHGKTTTTSLIASMLTESQFDPTFIIGGKLESIGKTAAVGHSDYFVAEADESDASFLYLHPKIAVVTNIDQDHMHTYDDDLACLDNSFIEFLQQVPQDGLKVLCIDDPGVNRILPKLTNHSVTYGFEPDADVVAQNWHQKGLQNCFDVVRHGHANLNICFGLPGRHNVLNALAAIAVATHLGLSNEQIKQGLEQFEGVGRRFQMLGDVTFPSGNALVIDDYGHHPNEISSTIDAIRQVWPNKRLVHVFQPHRYSRTQALFNEFSKCLALSDSVILLDIFSAGEEPVEGVDSTHLAEEICSISMDKPIQVTSLEQMGQVLDSVVEEGDIVLMQGAGSIGKAATRLAKSL